MKTVLVIEDALDIGDVLQVALKNCGYSVLIARTTDEGFSIARKVRPDIILLDYILPGSLGSSDLVQALKSEDIPSKIILMSGISDPAQKAKQLGLNRSIQKPFNTDDLLQLLEG